MSFVFFFTLNQKVLFNILKKNIQCSNTLYFIVACLWLHSWAFLKSMSSTMYYWITPLLRPLCVSNAGKYKNEIWNHSSINLEAYDSQRTQYWKNSFAFVDPIANFSFIVYWSGTSLCQNTTFQPSSNNINKFMSCLIAKGQ